MKLTQHRSIWLSRLLLVAALFAQGVLAAHACVAPDASAANSLSMQAQDVEEMPCHAAKKLEANECLMHCTQPDQVNLDHHTMAAALVEDVVLLVAMPQLQHKVLTASYTPVVLNTGPPLSIRFCSFLI